MHKLSYRLLCTLELALAAGTVHTFHKEFLAENKHSNQRQNGEQQDRVIFDLHTHIGKLACTNVHRNHLGNVNHQGIAHIQTQYHFFVVIIRFYVIFICKIICSAFFIITTGNQRTFFQILYCRKILESDSLILKTDYSVSFNYKIFVTIFS